MLGTPKHNPQERDVMTGTEGTPSRGPWSELAWRTARASSTPGGACVQVAALNYDFAVRDSKHTDGPVLVFDRSSWSAFVTGAKSGAFDRP